MKKQISTAIFIALLLHGISSLKCNSGNSVSSLPPIDCHPGECCLATEFANGTFQLGCQPGINCASFCVNIDGTTSCICDTDLCNEVPPLKCYSTAPVKTLQTVNCSAQDIGGRWCVNSTVHGTDATTLGCNTEKGRCEQLKNSCGVFGNDTVFCCNTALCNRGEKTICTDDGGNSDHHPLQCYKGNTATPTVVNCTTDCCQRVELANGKFLLDCGDASLCASLHDTCQMDAQGSENDPPATVQPVNDGDDSEDGDEEPAVIGDWDMDLLPTSDDQKFLLFRLANAANYLAIKGLLRVTAMFIADKILGQSIEWAREWEYLLLVNDYTPEEWQQFLLATAWAREAARTSDAAAE